MSQVFVADGNNYEALSHIRYRNVISNSHKKSLEDGSETFDFTTHADKPYSSFIGGNNRIIIPGEDGDFLEFIIYEVQEDRIERELEVYSYASYAELRTAKVIPEHTTSSLTVGQHAGIALDSTEWRVGVIESDAVRTIQFESRTHPYGYLKRLASVFNLELHFRIEHHNGKRTGRYVDLLERVGEWRGRRVEFGKDLLGLRRVENTEEIVTALNVIGPADENGDRLEVVVEDEEAFQRWSRNGNHIIKDYEPQFEMEENATEERLIELGEAELAKRVNAIVSYEGTIADLEKVPGLEHKKFRFGDTIQIRDTSYEPALYLDARIFFQDRDIKDQAEKQVRLGDFTEYTEEEVNAIWKSLQAQIQQKISMSELTEATYTKPEIDEKDKPGNDAADKIETDVGWTEVIESEQGAQDKADQAEDDANWYTDQIKIEVDNELLDKADLEYVDGQLQYKADAEVVNELNDTVSGLQDSTNSLLVDVANNAEELEAQGGRITTVRNEFDEVAGQLDIAIQDIGTLDNAVSTQGTQISANSEAISFKADSVVVEGLQDEFDNLSYENRNLVIRTNEIEGSHINQDGEITGNAGNSVMRDYIKVTPGEVLTFTKRDDGDNYWRWKWLDENEEYMDRRPANAHTFHWTVPDGAHFIQVSYPVNSYPKVERGNKATEWKLAPEDIDADISAVGVKIIEINTSLEIMEGNIEAKAERSVVENLSSDVTTISNEVGNLSVAYDEITAEVSRVESKTDDNISEIGSINTELGIQAGQIQSKVDETYVTGAIADIEVSGRNLARGTSDVYQTREMNNTWRITTFREDLDVLGLNAGDEVVYRVYLNPLNGYGGNARIDFYDENNDYTSKSGPKITADTGAGYSSVKWVVPSGYNEVRLTIGNEESGSDLRYSFELKELKFEKGNIATGWTPAPEDVQSEIDSVYEYAESQVTQLAGRIDSKAEASVVTDIETRTSSAEQSIDALEGQITSKVEQSVYNTLEDRVDTAESTITQQSNQIQSKVEENDVRSIFTQEADSFTFDASQINFTGHIFGGDATFNGFIESTSTIDNQVYNSRFNGEEFRFVRFKSGISNPNTENVDLSQVDNLARIYHDGVAFADDTDAAGFGMSGIAHSGTLNYYVDQMVVDAPSGSTFMNDVNFWGNVQVDGDQEINGNLTVPNGSIVINASGKSPRIDLDNGNGNYISTYNNRLTFYSYPGDGVGSGGVQIRQVAGSTGTRYPMQWRENGTWRVDRDNLTTTSGSANMRIFTSDNGGYSRIAISSSRRAIKEDIQDVEFTLDQIQSLQPVTFQDKAEYEEEGSAQARYYVGLVAEDVAASDIPLLAERDTEGNPASVSYDRVGVVALSGVQSLIPRWGVLEVYRNEHERRIDMLEMEVFHLTEENSQLISRLSKLEEAV
ncbi:phage minor structural protein, N-terminal region [Gracilibacillus orientalis]|uniref:Phage minor structural protein, N-terminal region n=1 Tax=Gracilibacillus orientalis TaxID=334253 RepID=A0A1I4HAB8_9BACI|nr:phage tail spike protein [Gracilibacillus orientalis]SFL38730.1 phage minor structural protein, N-terminal region [Gracilibacillus orientalis]